MKKVNVYFIGSILVFAVVYYGMSQWVNKEIILPKFTNMLDYIQTLTLVEFFQNVGATLLKSLLSYGIAFVLGLILAVMGQYKNIHQILSPYINMMKTLPVISIIIIVFIWFGKGLSIYLIAIMVILPLFYEMFLHKLATTDPRLLEVCHVYHLNKWDRFKYLTFYRLLEGFIVSFKQTFGLCFKVVVTSEVIGQAHLGIGSQIQMERMNLNMSGVFVWTFFLIVLVILLDGIIAYTSKNILKWEVV